MSHFLKDRPHLWHGNLMKMILTLGLLSILVVSEIKAQTGNSVTPPQSKRVCNQTHTRTHQSKCQPCVSRGEPCYPGSVLVSRQPCPYVGYGFNTCRVTCKEEYTEKCCLGFWGDDCMQECPGGSDNPCNGHGKCSSKNGQCLCEAGFKGTACEQCTNVTEYWPNCSPESGMIIPTQAERFCKQTYKRSYQTECQPCSVSGSPCRPGYASGAYEFNCGGNSGSCRYVCHEEYTPEYCCHGFWGEGCIQECPGGSGNPCNGHGECSRKNGQCECEPGFAGIACELCTKVNKYGPNCSLDFAMFAATQAGMIIPAQTQRVCKQTFKSTHKSECQPCTFKGDFCYPGSKLVSWQPCPYVGYGFKTCRVTCEEQYTENCCLGFWGDDCMQECPGGSRNPCNGRGKCSSKNGECFCEAGFKGTACELCTDVTKYWPNCSPEPGMIIPTQAERFCRQTYKRNYQTGCQSCSFLGSPCRPGYASGAYQFNCGGNSESCRFVCEEEYTPEYCCHGYWGEGCIQECPGGSGNPCNGHGECSRKTGQCFCEAGFKGTACELCTDVTKYGPDCSLEFALSDVTEVRMITSSKAKRICNETHKPTHVSECQPCTYKGNPCYPGSVRAYTQHDCPDIGYGFKTCRLACREEYTEKCCLGFWGDDCIQECPGGSENPCNGHGKCASKNGQCLCEAGFKGTACEQCTDVTKYWPDCLPEAGMVIPTQAERFCKQTYKRIYQTGCQSCSYFGSPCRPGYASGAYEYNCGGNSQSCRFVCEEEYTPEYCCHGFWGEYCIKECPGGRQNPCNGHGECSRKNGQCFCDPGFAGTACELCTDVNKYGPNCSLECPGGSENPCNGHGDCSRENGQCVCEPGFAGTACELCTDVNKYGPNCSLDCKCQDGECNNGIHGDGLCKPKNPCQSQVSPCGRNSQCIHTGAGKHACVCDYGYAGFGSECRLINPCLNNSGGCDVTTYCVYIGPYEHTCQCKAGYEGYIPGKGCRVENLCRPTTCGPNSVCETVKPYTMRCTCKEGYGHYNGSDCVENKIKTQCTLTNEGERNCTCPEFMVGDGITCRRRTIAEEIMEHPQLAMLGRITKMVKDFNNMLDVVNSNYTFFAPDDRAFMKKFKKNTKSLAYWSQEENALSLLKRHTIRHSFSAFDLKAPDGVVRSYPTLYDGYSLHIENINENLHIYSSHSRTAVIKKKEISAINGKIHVIDQVLVPLIPHSQEPSLKTLLSKPKYKIFYKALQQTNVLKTLSSLKEYTLFVFPNEALLNFKRNITADFMKYHILPQSVSTNSMFHNIEKDTILGSRYRLEMKGLRRKIYVNGVRITRPGVWTDVGVVYEVRKFLRQIYNRCDLKISETAMKTECCSGYFGRACDGCPGGPEDPCSGHGTCDDGVDGSGKCKCNPGFSGELCDRHEITIVLVP